jgi:hypothetical protein
MILRQSKRRFTIPRLQLVQSRHSSPISLLPSTITLPVQFNGQSSFVLADFPGIPVWQREVMSDFDREVSILLEKLRHNATGPRDATSTAPDRSSPLDAPLCQRTKRRHEKACCPAPSPTSLSAWLGFHPGPPLFEGPGTFMGDCAVIYFNQCR